MNTTHHAPVPFIVGAARSGTTLLRLMVDSHPLFAIPPETHFIPKLVAMENAVPRWRRFFGGRAAATEGLVRFLAGFPTWPDFNIREDQLRSEIARLGRYSTADAVRAFYRIYAEGAGKERWGDKTPGYSDSMPLIEALLPEARFIHIIRDGRDVAVSVRPLWFRPGNDLTTIALDWKGRIERTRGAGKQVRHYMELRYEALVENPEPVLRRVCEFLHVDFAPEMMRYWEHAADRLGEVSDRWQDGKVVITRAERLAHQKWTSSPPEPARIGRWREEFSDAERAEYEAAAGEVLRALGYL